MSTLRGFSSVEIVVAVALAGAVVGLGFPGVQAAACRSGRPIAAAALAAVAAQERDALPTGAYVDIAARGASGFTVSAVATVTTFTATAVGAGRYPGLVWQIDQTGAVVDVSGICEEQR